MSRAPTLYATIKDGKILGTRFWEAVSLIDGAAEFTVQRAVRKRSLSANNFYWAICEQAAAFVRDHGTEFTKGDVHRVNGQFLIVDAPIKDGLFVTRIRSTTELSKEEFSEFMEKTFAYWAELGCVFDKEGAQKEMFEEQEQQD